MARQPTTRLQVSGYRFLVRRMEHALLRGDRRMLHDPMRAQSLALIAGCVLAVIVVAVCAILAFLRPAAGLGDAPIIIARESGALYVRVNDIVHPVLNLASARLITGSAANPQIVNAAAVDKARRGPLLGIPGAPAVVAPPLSRNETAWTVCDGGTTTTVIAGPTDTLGRQARQPSVLAAPRGESAAKTYLLYDGGRAAVDLRNPAVVWALRLDNIQPRLVSAALLDAIPEAPPISPPQIPGAGSPGAVTGMRIGTVVQVTGSSANDYFVMLADGVQRIGEVAANLIRVAYAQGSSVIPTVSPDVIGHLRVIEPLSVSTYPWHADQPLNASAAGVLCAQWRPDDPKSTLWSGDSLPTSSPAIELAQADGDGPHVDSFVMPIGRSAYMKAAALNGDGGHGPLYWVSDSAVLFGVRDPSTAKILGVQGEPVEAPWPVLSVLPRGPELSPDAALVARDGVASSP